MKNILVTGAGGFIGSRIAIRLANEGHNVVALVNNIGGKHEQELFAADCLLEFGSITDFNRMRNLISLHEIDTVYHLAAYAIVRLSARDPLSTYQVNVMGTVNVLEACRVVGGVNRIIVASSDKAYGDHEKLPYTEGHPLQPLNTYDTSKACMDMISRTYANNYDMPICVTRCSNVYGPGDRNWSRIIPNTIKRVINNQPPMLYADVEDMVREFIYIDDVVDAYMLLGQAPVEITKGQAYNIGGTVEYTVRDIIDIILGKIGSGLVPIITSREESFREIKEQYIDASKLNSHVGWSPKTNISDGIKNTIDWIRANT